MRVLGGTSTQMKDAGLHLLRNRLENERVVFFDIDDTLLDTSQQCQVTGFMKPIVPIKELYEAAKAVGMSVVIITARPDYPANRQHTEQELRYHQLSPDLLYLRPSLGWDTRQAIQHFKRSCREDALKRLNRGKPLFSIGDQTWDFGESGGTGLWIRSLSPSGGDEDADVRRPSCL